jgi:predicted ribonuclease YlaK
MKAIEGDPLIRRQLERHRDMAPEVIDGAIKRCTDVLGDPPDVVLAETRYGIIAGLVKDVVRTVADKVFLSEKIDKIVIFCNTVATKNSAKLGYYPGTRDEKLLDSQIGNMLSTKLGGRLAVEQMIEREELILLPFSDIRGYDTSGMNAGVYITEAQNLDIELMKLALQRIGEDSICIIDGDYNT